MPLTTVDPTPALVVIDLQSLVLARGAGEPIPAADVVARSAQLADAFRAKGYPVVLVNVSGSPSGRTDANPAGGGMQFPEDSLDLVPELGAVESDVLVTKPSRGAFHGTPLHQELQARGVTQVFVTGIATSIGALETAQQAFAHGYHVVTVVDAMTDRSAENHEHTITRVFPGLSQTTTTAELLAAL